VVVQQLTVEQCEDLLARTNLGRLACARADQPYIVPVFFYFDREKRSMYSFSTLGQKIEWMRNNPKVCIEVEEIVSQFNWKTVVAFGKYEEIGQSAEESDARRRIYEILQRRPRWWLPGAAKSSAGHEHAVPVVYRILIERVSGRHASRPVGQ
jgi:uncharacterized protein